MINLILYIFLLSIDTPYNQTVVPDAPPKMEYTYESIHAMDTINIFDDPKLVETIYGMGLEIMDKSLLPCEALFNIVYNASLSDLYTDDNLRIRIVPDLSLSNYMAVGLTHCAEPYVINLDKNFLEHAPLEENIKTLIHEYAHLQDCRTQNVYPKLMGFETGYLTEDLCFKYPSVIISHYKLNLPVPPKAQ